MTDRSAASYGGLAAREPIFAVLIGRYGRPDPFAWHDGGRTGESLFAALCLHIVGQQISAVVAFRVFDRIAAALDGPPTPQGLLRLGPDRLRDCGLSHAKAGYLSALAEAQRSGAIDVEAMSGLGDEEAIARLVAVPGVGLWTAQTFLIHQLRRPDVLPAGETALRKAVQALWRLDAVPPAAEVIEMGRAWSPWRTYAATLLWRSLHPPGEPFDPKERALATLGES